MSQPANITEDHCQNCGSRGQGTDGYSACCNERIVSPIFGPCQRYPEGDCFHA